MKGRMETLSNVLRILVSPFTMMKSYENDSGIEIYYSACTKIHWHTTLTLFTKVSANFNIPDKIISIVFF